MPKKPAKPQGTTLLDLMSFIERLLTEPPPAALKQRAPHRALLEQQMDNLVATLSDCVEKDKKFVLPFNQASLTVLLNKASLTEKTLHALWHASHIDMSKSKLFIDSGIIPFLSQIIAGDFSLYLKEEASHFLLRLSTFTSEAQYEHFVSHGGLAVIVGLIETSSLRIQSLALERLNSIFPEIENTESLKRYLAIMQCSGLISSLFGLLKSERTTFVPNALDLMASVLNRDHFESTLGPREITVLFTHLMHPNPFVAERVCSIIAHCAKIHQNQVFLVQKSSMEILLARLKSILLLDDFDCVRQAIFECFIHLHTFQPNIGEDIANSGLLPLVVQELGLRSFNDKTILQLLHKLGEDAGVMTQLIEAGTVPKLIPLLDARQEAVVILSFKILFQVLDNRYSLEMSRHTLKHIIALIAPGKSDEIRKAALQFLLLCNTRLFDTELKTKEGLTLLLDLLSLESKSDVLENALKTLSDFLADDSPDALDSAEGMVNAGVKKALSNLFKHPKSSIQNRAGFLFIQVLHHLPTTPIEPKPEVLKALLTQLDTHEQSYFEKVSMVLLTLARQIECATALVQAGGLPFLFAQLTSPLHREHAAIALVNVSAKEGHELLFESAFQMGALVSLLEHKQPKLRKRALNALFHLAARPEHAVFIREVGGIGALANLQRNQPEFEDLTGLALKRLSPKEERSEADEESPSPSTMGGDNTELHLKRREKKIEKQTARITQLMVDIRTLQVTLFESNSEDLGITTLTPRQALVHLKTFHNDLTRRYDAILSSNVDLLVQNLYQGTTLEQRNAAIQLIIISGAKKLEVAEKVAALYCRDLFNHSSEPLKSKVAGLFQALYSPSKTLEDKEEMVISAASLLVKERPLAISFIHDICRLLGDVFEQVHPMLVGSQAKRLQHGTPFDPAIDFDFEIFCFTSESKRDATSIQTYLLYTLLPPGTSATFLNTDRGHHVLGFSFKDSRLALDFKFSIYAGVMPIIPDETKPLEQLNKVYGHINPMMPVCILNSLQNRRLTNRATMIDLRLNLVCFFNPRYRGFINKMGAFTTIDYGYALYDLGMEQQDQHVNSTSTKLLNEPHFRKKMTDFFQATSPEQHDLRREALAYTRKHLNKKLSEPPYKISAPSEYSKILIQKALQAFEIDLPDEAFIPHRCIEKPRFFKPVVAVSSLDERLSATPSR